MLSGSEELSSPSKEAYSALTMSAPIHDFAFSLTAAIDDEDLRAQLIKYFKTDELSAPGKSELVDATSDVMTWVIQQARSMYVCQPERLVGAISASRTANALAVWSRTRLDWIVISEGLMKLLRDAADDMGRRFVKAFPEVVDGQIWQCLQGKPPLKGGFQTTLGSLLYFAAITFFAGHEAGHHLAGHDGYFVKGSHAEAPNDPPDQSAAPKLTDQALEQEADWIGLMICRISMIKLLSKLWEVREFNAAERQSYQRSIAALLGAGAMMAVVKITPSEIDWTEIPGRSHPPAVVRILNLATTLSRAIKENFSDLDDVSRRWIRLMCMEVAVGATIKPGTDVDRVYQERIARGGEPAAIRAVGIRKAIHDPQLAQYNEALSASLQCIKPQLRPRKRT